MGALPDAEVVGDLRAAQGTAWCDEGGLGDPPQRQRASEPPADHARAEQDGTTATQGGVSLQQRRDPEICLLWQAAGVDGQGRRGGDPLGELHVQPQEVHGRGRG